MAIIDWFSRYVVNWAVSIKLNVEFCVDGLGKALIQSKPEIFNSDQGSQFTSKSFTDVLGANGITISMDGRGRAFDNIFIERLWRSVKYEEMYLKDYDSLREAVPESGGVLPVLQPGPAPPVPWVQDPVPDLHLQGCTQYGTGTKFSREQAVLFHLTIVLHFLDE